MEYIRSLLRTLGTAAIMSRQNDSRCDIKKLSVVEKLKAYFNVGIEKLKSNYSYSRLCPLDHLPVVRVPKHSAFKNVDLMIKK